MGKDVKLNFALYWNGAERVRRGTAKQSRKREIRPEQESGAALTGSFWSVSRFRSFSRFRSSCRGPFRTAVSEPAMGERVRGANRRAEARRPAEGLVRSPAPPAAR